MMNDATAPGRVLIVDDQGELVTALCTTLADRGYETVGFTAGEEALQALRARAFDILLTDLRMPGLDGIAVLRAALEIDPHLVGIIMTGEGTIETAVDAMKVGALDYVLKPVKLAALLPILSRAMEVRRLRMENMQLRETVAVYELSTTIAHTLEPDAILGKAADAALQQCQADEVSVMVPTDGGDELYVAVARGEVVRPVLGERVPMDRGIAGWVARCREPVLLHGEVTDPRFTPVHSRPDIRSAISMPMLVGGRLVGVLNVNRTRRNPPFSLGQLKGLSILAGLAASALESAQLYEEIRQHAAALEERVRERTAELEAANEKLAAASRHKSEFLANMSHELRTPLNSILGFSELLLEQTANVLSEKQTRFLTHIHTSGHHLLQLINDILDISKVEAGKFVLQPEPLPIATILEDILVIARGLANKKGQTIEAEVEPKLPVLPADPTRFKQILFNLLSNAVKFTPERGTISVRARRVPGIADFKLQIADLKDERPPLQSAIENLQSEIPGDFLEIAVTDTGIGIKPEDLPRLFQEFVQLEAAGTKRHEGTGLGLALTKKLVDLHGGRIWAESEGEGHGSTFTILLPFTGPEA